MKALRKDRDERYQTINELITDLRRVKQRLEFESELERSSAPGSFSGARLSELSAAPTSHHRAMPTVEKSHVSSAEYIASGIKSHRSDTAGARKSYKDFFALWKDADPDLPVLVQARKEYEALR